MSVHFSSQTDEWSTPDWLFQNLSREFLFTLDPCATAENAKCPIYYTRSDDGLSRTWGSEVAFINPPYGRVIGEWVKKSFLEAESGATCVCLLPARTDTKWFHSYCMKAEIRFIRGRLHFGNSATPAPFPSMIVIFRPPSLRFVSLSVSERGLSGKASHMLKHQQN